MSIVSDFSHHECCNWAAWCWLGEYPHPLPATQCGSAEGDYRAPPEWCQDTMDAPEPPKIKPNTRNAQIVQDLWESWPTASPARQVLKAEYPARHTSGRVEGGRDVAARRLNMSVREYEMALSWASKKIEEAFKGG